MMIYKSTLSITFIFPSCEIKTPMHGKSLISFLGDNVDIVLWRQLYNLMIKCGRRAWCSLITNLHQVCEIHNLHELCSVSARVNVFRDLHITNRNILQRKWNHDNLFILYYIILIHSYSCSNTFTTIFDYRTIGTKISSTWTTRWLHSNASKVSTPSCYSSSRCFVSHITLRRAGCFTSLIVRSFLAWRTAGFIKEIWKMSTHHKNTYTL